MKLENVNKLLVAGFGVLITGAILTMASLFMFGWLEKDNPETTFSLWRVCVTVAGNEVCDRIPDEPGWLDAVRRMSITSNIQSGISTLMTVYFMYKTSLTGQLCSRGLITGIAILGTIAFVLQTISVIVYGAKYEDDLGSGYDLAHAFIIHVIAAIFVVAGVWSVFFSYKKSKVSDGHAVVTTTVITNSYPSGPQGYPYQHPQPLHPPYGAPTYPMQQQQPMYPMAPYGVVAAGGPQKGGMGDPAYPPPPPMMRY